MQCRDGVKHQLYRQQSKSHLSILAHNGEVILSGVQLELFHFGLQSTLGTVRAIPGKD